MSAARQFNPSDRCAECRRPLSRYNPFTVCGPCRIALTPTLPPLSFSPSYEDEDADIRRALERFPTRPQVNPPDNVSKQ